MPRQQSQKTVSLFPFLAVLVCTMGALILLLLVTTRRIRQDAHTQAEPVAVASDDPEAAAAAIFDSLDELAVTGDTFASLTIPPIVESDVQTSEPPVASTPAIDIRLAQIDPLESNAAAPQATLVSLRDEIAELRQRIVENEASNREVNASIELARLELEADDENASHVDGDILDELMEQERSLSRQLEFGQQRLAELQAELEERSETTEAAEFVLKDRESDLASLREYVRKAESVDGTETTLVDFTNSTGTERAPIVINVTGRGFEFLPADVKIDQQDMLGFPANDNPLLAGIMAVHEQRFPTSVTVKPYVLLLVRPTGSLLFYSAQRSLSEAGIHFGYELLEEGRTVAVGDATASEQAALQQSIRDALLRRQQIYGFDLRKLVAETQPEKRKVRVMPDGRVLFEDDADEGHDGRYFAGGQALPQEAPDAFDTRAISESPEPQSEDGLTVTATPKVSPDAQGSGEQEDVADQRLAMANSERSDTPTSPWTDGRWDEAIDSRDHATTKSDDGRINPFAADPNFAASAIAAETGDGAMPEFAPVPEDFGAAMSGSESVTNRTPVVANAEAVIANGGEAASADGAGAAKANAADILGRPESLLGNLGVGSRRILDFQLVEPTEVVDSSNAASPTETAAAANFARRPEDCGEDVQHDQQPTGHPQSVEDRFSSSANPYAADRTDSPERSDWSDVTSADATSESRPVGPPENQIHGHASRGSDSGPRNSSGEPSNAAVSDTQRMIQKHFGQRESKPTTATNADPMLRSLFRSAINNDPTQAGFHAVTVTIHHNSLEVGSFQPIDTTGWDTEQIVEMTLEALSAEVQLLPAHKQADAVPTIDFIVGPSAGLIQQRMEVVLNRMQVPTRTIINVVQPEQPRTPISAAPASAETPVERPKLNGDSARRRSL